MRRRAAYASLAVVLLGAGFLYGYFFHRNGLFPAPLMRSWSEPPRVESVEVPPGRWNPASSAARAEMQGQIDELRAIGYLSGSSLAPEVTGVTLNDPSLTNAGLNLYTSGHAPEGILMDMDGAVLHRWAYSFEDVWPPGSDSDGERPGYFDVDSWRRAHLFDNGDLLVIYEGFGVAKLDRDSNLLWSYPRNNAAALQSEPGAHHDLFVDASGLIYVLTRYARVVPRVNPGWPILEDFITVLTPDGEPVESLSLLEAFERSLFATLLGRMAERGDIFHTNTIEVFDGRHAATASIFKQGNVLISLRELNVIAIVDMELGEVVWAITGLGKKQHQPTLLDNGNMLLFDNLGNDGKSEVIEFNPPSQQAVWRYPVDASVDLFSATCGSNQRLPNGNTLITETDAGRAFEVDPAGAIVWEFLNPQRAGDDDELIASLFEVIRLPADFPVDWLTRSPGR